MIKNGLKPVAPWDEKGFKLPGGRDLFGAGANLWPPAHRHPAPRDLRQLSRRRRDPEMRLRRPAGAVRHGARRSSSAISPRSCRRRKPAAMIRSLFVSLQELEQGRPPPGRRAEDEVQARSASSAPASWAPASPMSTAAAGIPVVLIDRDMEAADKGKAHSRRPDHGRVGEGPAEPKDEGEAALADHAVGATTPTLPTPTSSSRRCSRIRDVKKDVTEKAEAVIAVGAIFASNTSTLPITVACQELAAARDSSSASTSSRRSTR